jgi:DNA-directed RNA polymerase specialized sigma24 family protein
VREVYPVSAEGSLRLHRSEPGLDALQNRVQAIYEAELDHLLALCTLLVGGRTAGEDLAQSVFAEALQRERREPGYLRDPVWPWLRTVAVRLRLLANDVPDGPWDRQTVDVMRALRRLPPRMRTCTVLAYFEDQSTEVIAATLSCSAKTVENQLRESRYRLRGFMGAGYGDAGDE